MKEKLIEGNRKFIEKFVNENKGLMKQLAEGQNPKTLWIGCSDSRAVPELIVGAKLGELFVIRNIANIIPEADYCVDAVIEYAVNHLKIEAIVVCRHYGCGGMKGLNEINHLEKALQEWLKNSLKTKEKLDEVLHGKNIQLDEENYQKALVEVNVIEQTKNVKKKISGKPVEVVSLVYDIGTGKLQTEFEKLKELGIADEF